MKNISRMVGSCRDREMMSEDSWALVEMWLGIRNLQKCQQDPLQEQSELEFVDCGGDDPHPHLPPSGW